MQLPGPLSLAFLAYVFVLQPYAAIKSARRLRSMRAGQAALEARELGRQRESIWIGTSFGLAILFFLAWTTGRGFDYRIFALPRLGARELGLALAALALLFGLRAVLRAVRPLEERRALAVYFLAPRTGREQALWALTILCAAVAEEAAYRGVGMSILWYSLGNPWVAAALCALAFALAHWMQGWKSGVVIFAIALVMHGLVELTGTLVLAMVVHVLYDLVAGWLIAREARDAVA